MRSEGGGIGALLMPHLLNHLLLAAAVLVCVQQVFLPTTFNASGIVTCKSKSLQKYAYSVSLLKNIT